MSLLKLKRLSKQALAIVCALAILVCGVPMFAFADDATPDATVPAMKNEQVGVVFKNDGAVLDRTYASGASGMDWGYGWGGMLIHGFSGRVDAPDAIDVSSAEYFEFDMYVDHELESGFNVWLSSGTGVNPGRKMQGISAPKAGWNHFCLPLSGFGYNYGDLDFAAVKTLFFEGTISPVGADSARIIVANTAFTKSVPEMKNEYYNPVWSKEGLHITRTYERGNGTVWGAPGVGSWGSFFGNEFEDGGDGVALATVDASKAEYIEFDVYVSADMPAMTMWLSSNISTDSGRARGTLPATKAGWNHIVIPLSSFDAAGGSWGSGPYYSLAALKSYFVETTINPVDPEVSNVTIKFANFAFTKSYPKMANLNADPAWTYEGIVWSRTVANGGSSTPNVGNGPHLYAHLASNYNGGVAIDATGSDYLEFDVYCSTDLQEHSIRLWLNSMNWADCARRAADIPNFKKGWNHVVVSLDSFKTKVETQGTYSISSLRTMFIEAGATVAGCSCAIEKGFQQGGDNLRNKGVRVESLAIVESMDDTSVTFRKN